MLSLAYNFKLAQVAIKGSLWHKKFDARLDPKDPGGYCFHGHPRGLLNNSGLCSRLFPSYKGLTLSSLQACVGCEQVSTGYHGHDDSAVLPGQEKLAKAVQILCDAIQPELGLGFLEQHDVILNTRCCVLKLLDQVILYWKAKYSPHVLQSARIFYTYHSTLRWTSPDYTTNRETEGSSSGML